MTQEITKDHVTQAIVQIMRGAAGNGQVDEALAANIAGTILPHVQRVCASCGPDQLQSHSGFRNLIAIHIPATPTTDAAVQRAAILQQANITSSDYAAAERGLPGSASGRFRALITGDAIERSGMPDLLAANRSLSTQEAQTIASARALAEELRMPWAANNRELLRLGPAAIRTLHDAGVRRESFERMTSERVGIRAATAVNVAAFARRHNMTPEQTNQLFGTISDTHQSLSAGYPPGERRQIQRELNQGLNRFMTGHNTPETRQELRDMYMRHAKTPEQRQQVDRTIGAVERAHHSNAAAARNDAPATAARNADVTQRGADVAQRNADVAARNADVAAASAGFDEPATATPRRAETQAPAAPAQHAATPGTAAPSGAAKPTSVATSAPAQTAQQTPPRPAAPRPVA